MITIIVAMDKNRVIGYQGKIPWHVKEDLQFFKEMTINKTVLMGRKTLESIGKALPNRVNLVVSSNKDLEKHYPGIKVVSDIESTLKEYGDSKEELMVIGGASVYKQAFPYARKVLVSMIDGEHHGDTYLDVFEDDFRLEDVLDKGTFKVYRYVR